MELNIAIPGELVKIHNIAAIDNFKMAASLPSYSVSVKGKVGPKLLFSILRRIDLTLAIGELAQQFVDEFSDDECKYVVSSIKVGNLESGPYKDVLLTEQSVILQDMGYRYMMCIYQKIEEEVNEPVNAFTVLMSAARSSEPVIPKKKEKSSGLSVGLTAYDALYNNLIDMLIDGHHLSFKSLSEAEYILKVFNIYKYIKKA